MVVVGKDLFSTRQRSHSIGIECECSLAPSQQGAGRHEGSRACRDVQTSKQVQFCKPERAERTSTRMSAERLPCSSLESSSKAAGYCLAAIRDLARAVGSAGAAAATTRWAGAAVGWAAPFRAGGVGAAAPGVLAA